MACFVSLSFSIPLSPTQIAFNFKERNPRKVSNKAASKTATNSFMLCSLNGSRISLNQGSNQHLTSPIKQYGELVSCCLDVSSCNFMKITGYWVGPDIDDGWGVVEAFINQIM
ncbi:hypothetical protein CFOL_v3_32162 [Cephalotus follicularis]|uniref:Uncharacterized protein n=1 Tax=Cephalotus follicularis TaxID=3775 RepID=A0A1Q3D8H8_CEPFO|nr:hypothetical protein CFOL_v3_32162 [Cephalotus follicularis]